MLPTPFPEKALVFDTTTDRKAREGSVFQKASQPLKRDAINEKAAHENTRLHESSCKHESLRRDRSVPGRLGTPRDETAELANPAQRSFGRKDQEQSQTEANPYPSPVTPKNDGGGGGGRQD